MRNEPYPTDRLDLCVMDVAFLEASVAGDLETASRLLEAEVPVDWLEARDFMEHRIRRIAEDPTFETWGPRALVLRSERRMVGHAGFHTPPGAAYLSGYAPGGVEMGYTVFESDRRRGYATEAVAGLMAWAREQGVDAFVLSIAPTNTPSLAVARRLGFTGPVARVEDEEDGPEDVYVC